MANEILVKTGTPIVWAHAADWPGGGAHGFSDDDYELDLTNVATLTAWQGAKGNLGATRAARYAVRVGIVFNSAPTAGKAVRIYWSSSESATAGTGNTGGASGTNLAYKGSEELEWLKQLLFIGSLIATSDGNTVTQIQTVGVFSPPSRYGMPVVYNGTDVGTHSTSAANMFVALIPIVDEGQ